MVVNLTITTKKRKQMSFWTEIDVENLPDDHRRYLPSILDAHATVEKEDILKVLKTLDFYSLKDIPHHLLRVVETMDMERFETEFSDKTWV